MSRLIEIILKVVDKATASVNSVDTAIKGLSNNVEKVNKQFKRMDFGFLSLIFGGMALQRIFGGFLRTVFESYKEVTGGNDALSKGILGVNAAFEFLKFSIFNALSTSPLFFALVDATIALVNGFSLFLNLHPEASQLMIGLSALLAVIGGGALGIGLIKQTGLMYNEMFKFLGINFTGSNILSGLEKVKNAALIGVSLYFAEKSLENFTEGKIGAGIGKSLQSAGALSMIWKPKLGLIMIGAGMILEKFVEDPLFIPNLAKQFGYYGALMAGVFGAIFVHILMAIPLIRKIFSPEQRATSLAEDIARQTRGAKVLGDDMFKMFGGLIIQKDIANDNKPQIVSDLEHLRNSPSDLKASNFETLTDALNRLAGRLDNINTDLGYGAPSK